MDNHLPLIGIGEATKFLEITEQQLFCRVDAGTIPAYRVDHEIRFRPSELATARSGSRTDRMV